MLTLMLGALGLGQALSELGDQKEGARAALRVFSAIDGGDSSPVDGLTSSAGKRPSSPAKGRIEFKHVNFTYPSRPDMQVCRDYSLVIEPGQMVALVGASGSGKSTIVQLLLRFYDPQEGAVLLDGEDLRSLNVRWLRSQIGYVGQEPVLFAGSVQENVAKGRAEKCDETVPSMQDVIRSSSSGHTCFSAMPGGIGAGVCCSRRCVVCVRDDSMYAGTPSLDPLDGRPTEHDVESGEATACPQEKEATTTMPMPSDDVVDACKASNAHDFVSTFPQGYATDVGEGSTMVSGGQKQRNCSCPCADQEAVSTAVGRGNLCAGRGERATGSAVHRRAAAAQGADHGGHRAPPAPCATPTRSAWWRAGTSWRLAHMMSCWR